MKPDLASAAARERDARVKNYPAMVDRGEISRADAEADIAAWTAIADWFAHGHADTRLTWSALEQATLAAVERRAAAYYAAPDGDTAEARRKKQDLLDRADAVALVHRQIYKLMLAGIVGGPQGPRRGEAA